MLANRTIAASSTSATPIYIFYPGYLRLINSYTKSPSFLRADSQRGTAELTIACRKQGRVV